MEQQMITNGGVQYVSQIAVQYVYLDFDGELTSYNGEILTVDNVEVQDSSLTEERIANIVAELNAKYADKNVIFVTERPQNAEYSTIFIGKTDAFEPYGNFAGLAETIDKGNQNSTDKAFVLLDSTSTSEEIISTISHETNHLIGTLEHSGEGLAKYADTITIIDGKVHSNITLYSGDWLHVYDGTVSNTIINSGGFMAIGYHPSYKNTVNNVTVNAGGSLFVYSGASCAAIKENGGYVSVDDSAKVTFTRNTFSGLVLTSFATVHSGTTADRSVLDSGANLLVYSGGVANNTTVNYFGAIHLCGGIANNTTLCDGTLIVSSGGVANSTTANSLSMLRVNSGGVASNTTIGSEASLFLDGGTLIGSHSLAGYITGSGNATGAIFNLQIDKRKTSDGYIIQNYSSISGAPKCNITVSGNQQNGTYNLAYNASSFTGSMTITNGSTHYGSVTVNSNDLIYNGKTYSLDQSNGQLTLTISVCDITPPVKPSASASTSSPTNSDIVVSAIFSSDSEQRQYSRNNRDWYTYSTGIVMSSNGSVYFRGIDAAGNISDVTTYTVNNIDKVAPTKPTASANITSVTNKDVTVTATFSADSSKKEYSFDNKTWQTYTAGIKFTSNGSVYFRSQDAAGNISAVAGYSVSNIDKTAPALNGNPTVTANGQSVTVSWNAASDNVAISGYTLSLDGTDYTLDSSLRTYTFNSLSYGNHTVTLYAIDTAGNKSSEKITNFVIAQSSDTIAPSISSVSLSQGANNYTFTASVTASDNKTVAANLKYFIKYASTQSGLNSAAAVSGTKFTLNEQAAGKTYYYQVGVSDEAGNTAWSSARNFTVASVITKTADLQISGYTLSNTSIKRNQSVTIKFNVVNAGSAAAGSSSAYIYDGTTRIGSISVAALNAGASAGYTYTIPANTLSAGTHNIRIEADAANVITESDESNNTVSKNLTVAADTPPPSPTPSVSSLVVTTSADTVADDGVTSLREALAYAATLKGTQTITFAGNYNISINSSLNISSDVVIDGGNNNVVISVNSSEVDVFSFSAEYLKINNIDFIATGQINAVSGRNEGRGRLLYLGQGEFFISNSSVEGFSPDVVINSGEDTYLQVDNCYFAGNVSGDRINGGAFLISGEALINNTTFFNNSAMVGGAIFVNLSGRTNAVNCTFVNNKADDYWYGVSLHTQGKLFVQNSIIVDDSPDSNAIACNMFDPYMCIRNNILSQYSEEFNGNTVENNIFNQTTPDLFADIDVDIVANTGNKYLSADQSKIKENAILSAVDSSNNLYYSADGLNWYRSDSNECASADLNSYLSQHILGHRTTGSNIVGVQYNSEPCSANLLENGVSQIVAWDKEKGAVGYVATDGTPGNKWRGIWDWDGKDVELWRVVGVGRFAGSKVDHDGILLYNGIGNTFAAWTNLNNGDYGYVNLCHVDGNFNTKCLTDLANDDYDDVLIYDEKGSFGVVLDGATYKDIWHVDNPKTNAWQLCGAGNFGGDQDKLIVKNSSGHLYFWNNNDSTFKTWNWSQEVIGYVGNDFEFVGVGDFEGDGIDDILLRKTSDNGLWVWEDGNASKASWQVTPGNGFKVEAIGDYNGDGKDDVLVREYNTGWGGCGYYAFGGDTLWNDLNARIETDLESKFAVIA